MKTRIFASVAVMSALGLLAPLNTHAFGLGKIELSSALNQPFRAEIAVTALKPDDEGKLQVKLATQAEFDKAGVKRSFLLTQLQFEVVEDEGNARIVISSSQPVKEPFVDFLLTATTGKGRLIREYTVLLDPPKNVFAKPQPIPKQKAAPVKKKAAPKKSTYQYPDPQMPVEVTYDYSSATQYGPVGRTDTLWDIARDTKPSSVISQDQMMMAILNANKSSFTHNNINGLKAGYTLDIPSVSEIQALSRKQAYASVVEQNQQWKNRNNVPAPKVDVIEPESTSLTDVDVDTSETMEKIEGSAATDEENTARLQLVSPTDDELSKMDELSPLGNKELTQLSEQLTLAQETIESQAQENMDIKSRMDLMEEQLQTLRKLVSIKDADLARMQGSLESTSTELEESAVDASEADGVLDDMSTPDENEQSSSNELEQTLIDDAVEPIADLETAVVEDSIEPTAEEEFAEVDDLFEPAVESEMSEVEAYFAQIGKDDTNVEPATDDSLESEAVTTSDEVLNDSSTLTPLELAKDFVDTNVAKLKSFYAENKQESLIAGFVAALLALILLLLRARGRKSVTWSDATASETAVTAEQPTSEKKADVSPQSTQQTATDADETSTDEDIIKAAYASLDADAVDSLNEEIKSEEEVEDPVIEPQNESDLTDVEESTIPAPEFQLEPELSEALEDETLDITDELDEPEVEAEDDGAAIEFNLDPLAIDGEDETVSDEQASDESTELDDEVEDLLDFNIESSSTTDNDTSEPESDVLSMNESNDGASIDFDESPTVDTNEISELTLDDEPLTLDIDASLDEVSLDDSAVELDLTDIDEDDDSLSIDLDLEPSLSDLSIESDIDDAASPDLPEVDLDQITSSLDEPSEEVSDEKDELEFDLGDFDEIDEAETKLDLAGAYVDMGDPEGARSILEEVLIDGSDEQKSKAQALLNDLS